MYHHAMSNLRKILTPLGNKPFENTVGKGEIARNECFLTISVTFCHFRQI